MLYLARRLPGSYFDFDFIAEARAHAHDFARSRALECSFYSMMASRRTLDGS